MQDLLTKFVWDHHPDVLCIVEPFVSLDSIPSQFLMSMNLVELSTNDPDAALPNLWMFCKPSLLHAINVVSRTDQQVSITVTLDSVQCVLTFVYARTTMEGRQCLWIDLASVKENFVSGPWLVFGDFNAGAPVCRQSCEEFQAMTDVCELIHVATRGAEFTWVRRRGVTGCESIYKKNSRDIEHTQSNLTNYKTLRASRNPNAKRILPLVYRVLSVSALVTISICCSARYEQ
ncbi:hypothetical protein ACLB2K_015987 [Fragaria x ananassa]